MRVMWVGDPHVRRQNLSDSERLLDFVWAQAKAKNCDAVVFGGDMFHNHALVDLEVHAFWRRQMAKGSLLCVPIYALVGNHDQAGELRHEREYAVNAVATLESAASGMVCVESAQTHGELGFVPYTRDFQTFSNECAEQLAAGATVLFCHQTFVGARYDNGFYAPDGFDTEPVKGFAAVFSGHIHTAQSVGCVTYLGTPKWDTKSDANEEKAIHVIDTSTYAVESISTRAVCTPIVGIELREGGDESILDSLDENSKNFVDLTGSSKWIAAKAKQLHGVASVTAHPTDTRRVGKPQGPLAFADFIGGRQELTAEQKQSIVDYVNVI